MRMISPWNSGLAHRPRGARGPIAIEVMEPRLLLSAATPPANIALTSDPGVQQMPSIAADPSDPRHLVVSYMDHSLVNTGYAGIGVAVSHDGGSTWTRQAITLPAGFNQGASDSETVFDGQGHVFVSFMAATFLGAAKPPLTNPDAHDRIGGFTSDNGVFIVRSDDGGTTWETPVAAAANLYTGAGAVPFDIFPGLSIDTFPRLPDGTPNPNFGNEYVTFAQLEPGGQFPGDPTSMGGAVIQLAVSSDGGQTWQLRQQSVNGVTLPVIGANDPAFTGEAPLGLSGQNNPRSSVGPDGDLYVAYFSFGSFAVVHSTDAGRSFSSADAVSGNGYPFYFGAYIGSTDAASESSGPLGAGGPTNQFRTYVVRDILADPARPGDVYVAESVATFNSDGAALDDGDIFFARSTDYGETWSAPFKVGGNIAQVLNDDNGGQISQGSANDVAAAQAMPAMAVDPNGNLAVIWYDTRHDPANHLLDVYGTASTDGGQTFSPNFRVTTTSFDANAGQFTSATGATSFFLGDRIGMTIAGGVAYASWTDTRAGNQNVEFAQFALASPPGPANDRFGPNDTVASATNLGTVTDRNVPRLQVDAGDSEYVKLTAAATGNLTVTASVAGSASGFALELRSADGNTLLATATIGTDGTTEQLKYAGIAGQTYLVRAAATETLSIDYSLRLQSLTADLGIAVVGSEPDTLAPGGQAYYLLEPAAAGSIRLTLTVPSTDQAGAELEVLDPSNPDAGGNPALLATGTPDSNGDEHVVLSVTKNQPVLLHVSGSATASVSFTLDFINLDLFAAGAGDSLPFPAGDGPSQVVTADVNHDGRPDLIVGDALADTISVLLGNGDGTFQAAREYQVGPMETGSDSMDNLSELRTFKRGLAVADLTGNGNLDIVATNPGSGDVSVLLGNGDGTFQPQRRYDAGDAPNSVIIGDFNGDGIPDLAVLSTSYANSMLAILIGRGDGSFRAAQLITTPVNASTGSDGLAAGDLNGDGKLDLLVTGGINQQSYIYLGNGDGTFTQSGNFVGSGPGLAVAEVNGDGIPDVVNANFASSTISYVLGNPDGSFTAAPQGSISAGVTPIAIAIADVGSPVTLPDGSTVLGPPDGHLDLIVADSGVPQSVFSGPPEVVVLPGIYDAGGFEGFGSPIRIATGVRPESIAVGDFNGDGSADVAFVDNDGVHVILLGNPPPLTPNDTPQSARDLGVVVHVLEPTFTIVPGHEDAYYTMTVPTEDARDSGDEVIDISAAFEAVEGAGLAMDVSTADGQVLASGGQIRLRAAQGEQLLVHVHGASDRNGSRGAGAYTLDIDVLPQLISVEAQPLLPTPGGGGPTSSLVLTFQGDRLDPLPAQDPSNYTVTWLGPNGTTAKQSDRGNSLNLAPSSIVYDPGANIDVASGLDYPTAVRQTVTLVFSDLLPAGSYLVEISPTVGSQPYNSDEPGLLAAGGTSHPLVQLSKTSSAISQGTSSLIDKLVTGGAAGGFGSWNSGNPSLTQLHDDLSALLDAALTQQRDAPSVSAALLQQIVDRFVPNPAIANSGQPIVAIWLDPVAIDLQDTGARGSHTINYDLHSGSLSSNVLDAYVSVAGNVELLVLPAGSGGGSDSVTLALASVNGTSRGGVVVLRNGSVTSTSLTDSIRDGVRTFDLLDYSPSAGLSSSLPSGQEPAIIFDLAQHVSGHFVSDLVPSGGQAVPPVRLIPEFTARTDEQLAPATSTNDSKPAAQPDIHLSPAPAPQIARVTIWDELVGQMRDGFSLLFKFIQDYLAKLPAGSSQDRAPDDATPAPSPKAAVEESNPQPTSSALPMSGPAAEHPEVLPVAWSRPARECGVGDRPGNEILGAGMSLKWLLLACGSPQPVNRRRR